MAVWEPAFPVNFAADGDYTSQAIRKHIDEIAKMYRHLNDLKKLFASTTPPENPDNYDVWLDAATMELKTYFEDRGWGSFLRVHSAAMSDTSQNATESGNSSRLGGYPASWFATDSGLRELRAMVEEAFLNPPEVNYPNFRGTWQDGGIYAPRDAVEYGGSTWLLTAGDGLVPPPDNRYWRLIAAGGKDFFMSMLDGGRADTTHTAFISGGAARQEANG